MATIDTDRTPEDAEASFRLVKSLFEQSTTVDEFRAHVHAQRVLDPTFGIIVAMEDKENVFVLGGLTYTGTCTLGIILEGAVLKVINETMMLQHPVGEA